MGPYLGYGTCPGTNDYMDLLFHARFLHWTWPFRLYACLFIVVRFLSTSETTWIACSCLSSTQSYPYMPPPCGMSCYWPLLRNYRGFGGVHIKLLLFQWQPQVIALILVLVSCCTWKVSENWFLNFRNMSRKIAVRPQRRLIVLESSTIHVYPHKTLHVSQTGETGRSWWAVYGPSEQKIDLFSPMRNQKFSLGIRHKIVGVVLLN